MVVLIVGGTSGLGLALAQQLSSTQEVIVTGRHDCHPTRMRFEHLDLNSPMLTHDLDALLARLPVLDTIIYAAGYFQEGRLDTLTDEDIFKMHLVGSIAPALLIRRVLMKQVLPEFIVITSTSQWTPRQLEPVYTSVKAGLAMLANSLALDGRIAKVLVAAPAGMRTAFWEGTGKSTDGYLDPDWVAEQILVLRAEPFSYCFARIQRNPPRVEIGEKR